MSGFVAEIPCSSDRLNKQIGTWCGINSLFYTDGKLNWTSPPVSPLPKQLKRIHYKYLFEIQTIWNKIVDRIARNREFLKKELDFVAKVDPFIANLLRIYENVPQDILENSVQFGIFRSDYMVDAVLGHPMQVEINTIASGFAALSQRTGFLQNYLLQRNKEDAEFRGIADLVYGEHQPLPRQVEPNHSLQKVAAAMAKAHEVYGHPNAVIAFVVQANERNEADQRLFESELWNSYQIRSEFVTLSDFFHRGRVDSNNQLFIKNKEGSEEFAVAVAYYRSGYTPNDYTDSGEEWKARELIEHSTAIKCPSVGYHLAGSKAIQAALCKANVLEQFLDSAEECEILRKCFIEQYSLGDPVNQEACRVAIDDAIENGKNWVLKPQREGGGNNIFGNQLSTFLKEHTNDPILSRFVLMRRIFPTVEMSAFYKQGHCFVSPSVSEVGIYGCGLYGRRKEILNEYCGYLVRTKGDGIDEGGVTAGFAAINALVLVDE